MAKTKSEMENVVQSALGPSGFMEFARLDHSGVVHKGGTGGHPKVFRLVIGNPLIMREMVKHVPDAGSYAPVTILIDERPGAFTCPMTEWRAFSRLMKTRKLLKWLRIWIQRLKPCSPTQVPNKFQRKTITIERYKYGHKTKYRILPWALGRWLVLQ